MAKPKGHKAFMRLRKKQEENEQAVNESLKREVGRIPKPDTDEIRLECDCGEESEFRAEPDASVVYRLACPFCQRVELMRWGPGEKPELVLVETPGAGRDAIPLSITPKKKLGEWWRAMPGYGMGSPYRDGRNLRRERAQILFVKGERFLTDETYLLYRGKEDEELNRLLVEYRKIDRESADRVGEIARAMREREENLLARGQEPKGDTELVRMFDELCEAEDLLRDIHLESGEGFRFTHPKLQDRERREALKASRTRIKAEWEQRMKIRQASEQHQLSRMAKELAIADTRGHAAPLVANARWLVDGIPARYRPTKFPVNTLVYELAKYICWNNCRTWPSMHDMVMAFAERDEVIREVIAKMPRSAKPLRTGGTRPVRYSPAVLHYLIRWWLEGPGRGVENYTRQGFLHVARVLVD